MNKSTKRIAVGALIAGVGGYLAGILTAPKSGRETREDIKTAAVKTTVEAEKRLKALHTELSDLIAQATVKGAEYGGRAKTQLNKMITSANTSKQKAREILSAIHEGDAEDLDLKKAVNETTQAVKHLKSFLKK